MGKSAKFFKRPTRKEKAVLSLTKGSETSLFDSATSSSTKGSKKDVLSSTANHTIAKKSNSAGTGAGGAAHPSKSSLAYKLQLNGGIKAAVKDLKDLDDDLVSEDEDMMDDDEDDTPATTAAGGKKSKNKKEDLDKSKPRPDYVELMYGKQGGGNKRKTFMPKPALIK
ncbi:hypothetical protein BGZ97_010553 [Linnemannia gamsii]|uniref:Uncharacterized protein n=1 Tax=Linnemannia gamsii TaxID=64522 RepID=A0A9P6UVN7_9FUNG|nr:hypothetical protein BGZ97_010553 [Linnemannia gamsii]